MPENNRNNRKGSNSRPNSQVNLAQKAGVKKTGTAAPKKKKKNAQTKKIVLIVFLLLVIVGLLFFLIVGGISVYRTMFDTNRNVKEVQLTSHDTTPEADRDKVAYYVLGILGKDEEEKLAEEKPTEALSLLCWDKQKKTVNILQFPQDTYYNAENAKRISDVWVNPKPLNWCESCRCRLEDEEISDGKHTVCGTTVTQKKGSASEALLDVFNDDYGLPVDGWFLIPQEALVKLVNLLGGVDVELEAAMTVGEVNYPAGVQTLDGEAAVYYSMNNTGGIDGDIARMLKQRKVLLGVFQRLVRQSEKQLTNDSIGPLMNGSTPILSGHSRTQMIALLQEIGKVPASSMTTYVVPGESAKHEGGTYFTPHRGALLTLLNEAFNPYGKELVNGDMKFTALSESGTADQHKQVLSDIEVVQSGAVATTTEPTTATTAA